MGRTFFSSSEATHQGGAKLTGLLVFNSSLRGGLLLNQEVCPSHQLNTYVPYIRAHLFIKNAANVLILGRTMSSEVSRSWQVFDDGAQAAHQAISGATTSGSVVGGVALEPHIFQFNVLVVGRATYFVEGGGEDSLLTLRPGTPSRCAAGVHVGPILGAASWALTWTGFNRSGSQSSLNMSSDALVTMARRIRPYLQAGGEYHCLVPRRSSATWRRGMTISGWPSFLIWTRNAIERIG